MGSGRGWLADDWPSTGGVLNITAAACTAGLLWWRSGSITRTQNVSEYMLVLALCLVLVALNKTRKRNIANLLKSPIIITMNWNSDLALL